VSGNSQPQFIVAGNCTPVAVTAANTSSEGGGTIATNIFLALTAGANGSWVDYIRWIATATAVTATAATVARVFLSTVGSGATTSANTFLLWEGLLSSVSAGGTTASAAWFDAPIRMRIAANTFILVTNAVAPNANSQWLAVPMSCGDY
jgi:hypothetical protein